MAKRIVYLGEKRTLPVSFARLREILAGDTLDSITAVSVTPAAGLSVTDAGVTDDTADLLIDANGATPAEYAVCCEVLTAAGAELHSDPIVITVLDC